MAAEGDYILPLKFIFSFFYFIYVDKKSTMGSQPNLVVSRMWCRLPNAPPPKKGAPSFQMLGTKTSNFRPLFLQLRTRHRISPERNVVSTDNYTTGVNLQCDP